MADRYYRKDLPSGGAMVLKVEDPARDDAPIGLFVEPVDKNAAPEEIWFDEEVLFGGWALFGMAIGDREPPAWAVGPIPATDVNGDPIEKSRPMRSDHEALLQSIRDDPWG